MTIDLNTCFIIKKISSYIMNQFCAIGLKVLAAAGVGVAVYFGIDKAMGNKKQNQPVQNQESPDNVMQQDNSINFPEQTNKNQGELSSGEKVVSGLKVAQDVFGRAFSLCQNLAMAAENVVRIFGKNDYNNQQGYGYYNDPYQNGYQDKYKDPPGYRRISPFILEYVGGPVNDRYYQRTY